MDSSAVFSELVCVQSGTSFSSTSGSGDVVAMGGGETGRRKGLPMGLGTAVDDIDLIGPPIACSIILRLASSLNEAS